MSTQRTIAVIGSRRRNDLDTMMKVMDAFIQVYRPGDRIVSGGAEEGADRLAPLFGRKLGATVITHYPNWKKYGRIATFMRNSLVAQDATHCVAAVHRSRTGGTEDTVKKFLRRQPRTRLILV